MDVTDIKNRVATATGLAAAVVAAPGGFDVQIDASAELFGLLDSLVSNHVYPLTMKERKATPSIVYTLVGVDHLQVDGYKVTQTDRYVLELRTGSYSDLLSLVPNCITALRTSGYSIEPIDMVFAYEEDQKIFHAELEIEVSYPLVGGGPSDANVDQLPMAIVYPIGRSADASDVDNYTSQRLTNQYAVVVLATSGLSTVLDAIRGKLLGWQRAATSDAMEYVTGSSLGGVGALQLWREVYQDWEIIEDV